MTWEAARPIVEMMLYAYAAYRRQPPAPRISSVYDQAAAPAPKPSPARSSVEAYVLRHDAELRLEGALNRLATTERQAIELRYFDGARWELVARRLNCSVSHARRKVEMGLYAIASDLGLLRDDPAEAA